MCLHGNTTVFFDFVRQMTHGPSEDEEEESERVMLLVVGLATLSMKSSSSPINSISSKLSVF
jgi:hypothetical protein